MPVEVETLVIAAERDETWVFRCSKADHAARCERDDYHRRQGASRVAQAIRPADTFIKLRRRLTDVKREDRMTQRGPWRQALIDADQRWQRPSRRRP